MNLVEELTTTLGVTGTVAEGLAGQVLSMIDERLREKAPDAAKKLRGVFPEITKWRGSAPTLQPGLTVAAVAAMAKEDELVGLLRRFGVDVARADKLSSTTLVSLAKVLDPPTMNEVARVFP